MDIEQTIFQRRSIRKYNEKPVEIEVIKKIIEAGTWAPSACNVQGWRFIVIDDPTVINEILKNGAAAFLKNVRQAILVIYNNQSDNDSYKDYIQSASACIENMLLMAHSYNVGTCWINFLPSKKKLRQILNIPDYFEPIALISLGYYDQKINEYKRKYTVDEIISFNDYEFDDHNLITVSKIKLRLKRLARKIYFLFPYKNILTKILNKVEKKFNN